VSGVPVRPELAEAQPYRWQEGLPTDRPLIRFDMNTQPAPPAWYAGIADRLARTPVQQYPDATYGRLRDLLAEYTGFPRGRIIPTAGADEALALCAQLVLRPGDRAYVKRPYYSWYENVTRLAGATITDRPDWARLTWVCTPHNPTGEDDPDEGSAERDGLVVIDQAYVEFGGTDLSHLVSERDNVVVVRTFSKAFALAGARVGYILAPEGISAQLDAIRLPAGIAAPSARMAEIALERRDQIAPTVELTCRERDRMAAALREAGYTVPESRANFVYVDLGRPNDDALTRLLERGLVVRSYADQPTALRITVAGPRDNDQLLETLCGSRLVRPAAAAAGARRGEAERRTKETDVRCTVDVDGGGTAGVTTGIGFLDHMLSALSLHAMLDLELSCTGDLWVDEHHTVEDVAIVLGQALDGALGERSGIARYGDARAPLDEALCHATVDLGGRGFSAVELPLHGDRVGTLPSSLVPHFFDSLSRSGRMAIHLEGQGADDHHMVEAAFKSFALALRAACARDERRAGAVPSTKGAV
jgi:imidazoleglycerol phosphate dehydratase HisB/histidinol-phosphate/aromatic aminotransferase/cobyric acid decarboxylase-like protein